MLLAIDPGTTESAYVLYAAGEAKPVIQAGHVDNELLRKMMLRGDFSRATLRLAIETMTFMGGSAGGDVFGTCIWIGRFQEVWNQVGGSSRLIPRAWVKKRLCLIEPPAETQAKREKQIAEGLKRKRKWSWTLAKDKHVRWALLNLIGPTGTKSKPGPTYGLSKHLWSALGIAVTAHDRWDD
jgi:hypothetical protein